MDHDALLLTHMDDLARRAGKTGAAHSKFLTPAEATGVAQAFTNRRDAALTLDGGFAQAERCVAIFTQPDWGVCERGDVLAGLRLRFRAQDVVRHQDVLGAVLGLGLTRDVLGDIVVTEGRAYTVCLASIADFIADELRKVGRVGVEIERIPVEELPEASVVLREKEVTVASPRLDAVLAAAWDWPRTRAAAMVEAGQVRLAHRECLTPSKPVQAGDIISAHGVGRFVVVREGGQSRKGRLWLVLGFYR